MRRLIPRARRAALIASASVLMVMTVGPSAYAADDTTHVLDRVTGVSIIDTHGVSVWRYTLALNDGNRANPGDTLMGICAWVSAFAWEFYRFVVVGQIWLLDWVLKLEWIDFILAPLRGLSVIVQSMINQIGLLPLTLAIAAAIGGYWLLRGRYAGGITELLIAATIAALATGVLANPMAVIAGDDGLIIKSRDAGYDLSTGFTTDGATFDGDKNTASAGLTGALADTLLRVPHQILNYGEVIDGTACEAVYDEYVGKDNAREKIRECNERYAEVADHPSPGTAMAVASLIPTIAVFWAFSVIVVAVLFLAVILLGGTAIDLLWKLQVGVVSGGARQGLFKAFANVAFGCIMVAAASAFVTAWMRILLGFYDATGKVPFLIRSLLFDIVLVIGAIVLFIIRHKVKKSLRGFAKRLAQLGARSAPTPAPSVMPQVAMAALDTAARLGLEAFLRRKNPAPPNPPKSVNAGHVDARFPTRPTTSTGATALPAGRDPKLLGSGGGDLHLPGGPAPEPPLLPTGPNPNTNPSMPTAATRLRKRLGTVMTLAGHAAALVGSGGTSAVVTGSQALAALSKAADVAQTVQTVHDTVRSVRSEALRVKLAASQPVRMDDANGKMRDAFTGVTFSRSTATAGDGVEILTPDRPSVAPADDVAALLRERLGAGG